MRILYSFLIIFVFVVNAQAQKKSIVMGTVKDEESRLMPLVTVSLEGSNIATQSDEQGNYRLIVPYSDTIVTIQFAYIGYETIKRKINISSTKINQVDLQFTRKNILIKEVIVLSQEERNSTITKIDAKLISNLPSASGNFEAILKTLPGVRSNNELSSQYNVRGGNFDENLVYVNDVEIYRPFLVRSGQQEGLTFINADMVSSVKFSAGGFDAKYGDKLSSVLDI
ncbi:MAG: carboxypeptidase-like regulatory domain-containing protein, partial [bacterium]